ncbi:ABC transporter ATP-binding protein [Solwaraspora sp. WMMD406]|uniref:ATP-binding cassette domain-containing protein n=1 Tax=Solwaraspora sp. WMMD406 TaxID=3016095 RepID=UPI0024173B85|nr:ABC transporter ATP-binding protein [Solwaraspora sp. WMMD406]MDG4766099.1 ABC transporter ATP-binding protein [Solwaraspora sp. WMMD406]
MTIRSPVARFTRQALTRHPAELGRLGAWSLVEALPALVGGAATARAVDDGFLAGRPGTGMLWLSGIAVVVLIGAVGTDHTYRCLARIVEPVRDQLTRLVVTSTLTRAVADLDPVPATVVPRLTHQVEIVRDTFAGLLMVVRGFLVTATAALVGLVTLAPPIAALVTVPLIAALAAFLAALPTMVARHRDYVHAGELLGSRASDVITGHRDITACGAYQWATGEVGRRVDSQLVAERRLARIAATRGLILAIGGWLPLVAVLLAAPWLVRRGLTAGAVLGALVYVTTALQPALQSLVQTVAGGGLRYVVTLDRLLGESGRHDAGTTPGGRPGGRAAPSRPPGLTGSTGVVGPSRPVGTGAAVRADGTGTSPPAAVQLRDVTFRYGPAARPVLENLTLRLSAGEHLGVVGPSGAGKSTFAAVVAGLRPAAQGEVRLAGQPVTGLDPTALAALRVVVPQEAYVFTATLADNLRHLRPDATDDDLRRVVDVFGLSGLIDRIGGPAAVVRPAALSAGERQLLATARAYLSPAPLVILDEATSHLDPVVEARVEQAFMARPGTLIVIAHRISSALRADRVLLIDGGPAVLGRHEEQLEMSDTYRSLVGHWSRPTGPGQSTDPADRSRTVS